MGRAEGYGIVHADEQYIVPTDGKPIRGLIQVHTSLWRAAANSFHALD